MKGKYGVKELRDIGFLLATEANNTAYKKFVKSLQNKCPQKHEFIVLDNRRGKTTIGGLL